MPIQKTRNGYDVFGVGQGDGRLYNLTKTELNDLLIDISCQNINDEFDEFGKAINQLDETIAEVV